jgi:hypothetical protein
VPFDLYVSRAPSFAEVTAPSPTEPGLSARPGAPHSIPIALEDFHALMGTAPATKSGDVAYRVRHPEGDPWFVAAWEPPGNLVLSTSYSYHRAIRNLIDMVYQGLNIARHFEARLFEEAGEEEIAAQNVDELMDVKGQYLGLHAAAFRNAMKMLDTECQAPLEYPVGPIDVVSEYFVFHVEPSRELAVDEVRAVLERQVKGAKVDVAKSQHGALAEANALLLSDATDGKRLVKALLLNDRQWQVWPAHGQAPFSRTANAALRVAESIASETQGRATFNRRAFDGALRDAVHLRVNGLGVDFLTWLQASAWGDASANIVSVTVARPRM